LSFGANSLVIEGGGNVIVNENSADADFRVESNARAYGLYVDGGTSAVSIGVAPRSDVHSTWGQLFLGEKGSLISENLGSGGNYGMLVSDNLYVDSDTGAFAFITDDEASLYSQEGGQHKFFGVGFGSAGAAATLVSRLEIDSSGNVVFNEGGNDSDFRIESTGFANQFVVDAGNNTVGIGRVASSMVLDLESASSGTLNAFRIRNSSTAAAAEVKMHLSLNRTGSDVDFEVASIVAGKEQEFTTTASTVDGFMAFRTIQNETTAEKMRITSAGLVGLGTTTPSFNMTIFGSGNTFLQISQAGDAVAGHLIGRSSSKDLRVQNSENANTVFWTNNIERVRIEDDGNVAFSGDGVSLVATDTYHVRLVNTTNQVSQLNYNSNASFTQDLHAWDAIRAGSSAFNFGRWRSNVGATPDSEFIFNGAGTATADGSWNGGGADYAEYFEWADGNSSNEDRVGISVKLDGTKIVPSTSSDDPSEIIGVISANPSVVGDTAGTRWQSKYERDEYNRYVYEAYTFTEWTVPATETEAAIHHIYPTDYIPSDVTVPSDAVVISKDEDGNNLMRKKLNSSFDESLTYVPRSDRKEWDTVGLMGKIRMTKGQKTGTNWIKMKDISDTVEEWLIR